MGDAASQHYQEAAMAGVPPGRGMPVPGMLPLCQGGPAAAHSLWPGAGLADGANSPLQEPALLAQLVQLLGQRPRHSLLLSDLGALLPTPLRHGVKEKGGLRAWLQKYPELFQVCGSPGKESVTLLLGSSAERVAANSNVLAMKPTGKIPQTELPQTKELATPKEGQGRKDDEDEENEAAVQMRGLPYRATVADVKKFLGDHAETLKDDCAIQLVANRDGRPSGFARVQFDSPAAARAARDKLHMQTMEVASGSPGSTGGTGSGAQDRYVEVFLYSERPNKLRIKKIAGGSSTAITDWNSSSGQAAGAAPVMHRKTARAKLLSSGLFLTVAVVLGWNGVRCFAGGLFSAPGAGRRWQTQTQAAGHEYAELSRVEDLIYDSCMIKEGEQEIECLRVWDKLKNFHEDSELECKVDDFQCVVLDVLDRLCKGVRGKEGLILLNKVSHAVLGFRKKYSDWDKAFAAADTDGSGDIDADEFKVAIKGVSPGMSQDEVELVFNAADVNGDGVISREEFSDFLTAAIFAEEPLRGLQVDSLPTKQPDVIDYLRWSSAGRTASWAGLAKLAR